MVDLALLQKRFKHYSLRASSDREEESKQFAKVLAMQVNLAAEIALTFAPSLLFCLAAWPRIHADRLESRSHRQNGAFSRNLQRHRLAGAITRESAVTVPVCARHEIRLIPFPRSLMSLQIPPGRTMSKIQRTLIIA